VVRDLCFEDEEVLSLEERWDEEDPLGFDEEEALL
jgi:hypothetical protein